MTFLTLIDLGKTLTDKLFGGQVLERAPAGMSIIYLIGMAVLLIFLVVTLVENIWRPRFLFERELPAAVNRKLAQTVTNRSLFVWFFVFVALCGVTFGFQVYWTRNADDSEGQMKALSYKDLRNRRTNAASLRGWMLDRTGKLDAALAYYKVDKDGGLTRAFSLDKELAHLLGTERGTPGLERTLYQREADPMPEAWEILTKFKKPEPENKDVRVTIHKELQAYIAKRIEGKKAGIVVIDPQNGDVLAMYSNPGYTLEQAESLEGYLKLEGDAANKPLLNRATREFYIPGSTFKTFTMISAFRAGRQNDTFPGRPAPDCYTPFRGSRPICDAGGSCHACAENVPLREAFKVSSNQYFSQLANALGHQRIGESAAALGIMPVNTPEEAVTQGFFPDIWNTSNKRIANSLAPARSTLVNGEKMSLYDSGVVGMGQGGAGQMTPFQMALIAAAAGNVEGKLMKPRIEADIQPQMFSQVLSPQAARAVREIMATVTEESGGTGTVVRSKLGGTGITTGGKTGTADKDGVQVYNPDGTKKMEKQRRRNAAGEIVEVQVPVKRTRWDGWFLCIAPLDEPRLAIAVVVEDIGGGAYGGTTAAPIAADVILKALQLGLLGDKYKPANPAPTRRR